MEDIKISLAEPSDIDVWMDFIEIVRWNFPGLEANDQLELYRQTVIKNIKRHTAICAKYEGKIVGVLLFSTKQNILSCMAVHPSYRRLGIASQMIEHMMYYIDRSRDLIVTTFCENDEKGRAPRALYKKLGFIEGELCEEFNYPQQRFILPRIR